MGAYISYYMFFSDNMKLIKDIQTDFLLEDMNGEMYDKAYGSFLNKFLNYCHTFAEKTFRSSSKMISLYISEVSETRTLPKAKRFDTLLKITESYMRRSM